MICKAHKGLEFSQMVRGSLTAIWLFFLCSTIKISAHIWFKFNILKCSRLTKNFWKGGHQSQITGARKCICILRKAESIHLIFSAKLSNWAVSCDSI